MKLPEALEAVSQWSGHSKNQEQESINKDFPYKYWYAGHFRSYGQGSLTLFVIIEYRVSLIAWGTIDL